MHGMYNFKVKEDELGGACSTHSSGLGPEAGSCEHTNEPLGSIEFGESRDYLRDC
jgi:hypothetical protein